MKQPLKPHNKRTPGKQSTAFAPGIFIKPSKTREGCFLVLQVESQRQQHIKTERRIVWDGSVQRVKVALDFAAIDIADYQHHMFGDEWDLRDLRHMVAETFRMFVLNARSNLKRIKGQ